MQDYIQLYSLVALYDETCDLTTIAGQFHTDIKILKVTSSPQCTLQRCNQRPDFFLHFKGKLTEVSEITFNVEFNDKHTEIRFYTVELVFPFEEMALQLDFGTSAVISTMCKDYSFRLDEWLQFNLQLGFSGIVVFDNDANVQNVIHEKYRNENTSYHPPLLSTKQICEKYKERVHVINFPYSPFKSKEPPGLNWRNIGHWTVLQRITLTLGANGLRKKCKHIAFIDPDEFLYMSNDPFQSIEDFLQKYNSVRVQFCYVTNKGDADFIDNNIVSLCKHGYIPTNEVDAHHMDGGKLLLSTDQITPYEFIVTPHKHSSAIFPIDVRELICYHCWVNKRLWCRGDMEEFNGLQEWFCKTKKS
jgi:hypothetical protein